MNKIINTITKIVAILLIGVIILAQMPHRASAALADYQKAQVSFTFDDGFESMYKTAPAILKAAGYKGTLYYITGIGDGTYQKGTTDDNKAGMTWAQVQDLQNNYGWEIGSHTVDHALLSTYTKAQVDQDLVNSNTALKAHGINAVDFAFPEGDYVPATTVETAKYYQSYRGFQDVGLMTYPYNNGVLVDESLDDNMTLAQAEALVDQAIANKQLLIFTGHGIETTKNASYAYTWTTANFQALVTYVKSKNLPVVTVNDAVKPIGTNLTQNASFENGMTNWSTDNATQTVVDTGTNGSYPSPTNSIKMTGGTAVSHLFSDLIKVVPGKDYLVNAFYNTLNLTAGEFGFYVDEYDANNNWISGQWLGAITNGTVGFFNKVIQTTSTLVSSFRIQTYLTGGSTGTVYTDNVNLYDMAASGSATVTPSVTPSATPSASPSVTPSVTPVAGPNLIQNGNFDSGLANGWTTDNATTVKADSANHGANPTAATSIGLTGSATAAHLFYGLLTVDPSATYNLSVNANTTGLTSGELGFYMDEYDASGTWISGQWLGAVVNGVTSTFARAYKATSTLVSQIRIQTYLTANSTGTGYIDAVNLSNQSATASATPTITITPTATPSATPTASPSATPTASPSATPSVTVTPSVSPTATPSGTVTPSVTTSVTPSTTPSVSPAADMIQNGSFDSGLASGWTTDNATSVKADSANHGAAPTTGSSIAMTGGSAVAHLFYSFVNVTPGTNYVLNAVANATGLTGGELGYYIDEYDAAGTWISGKWVGKVTNGISSTLNYVYNATSTLVSKIRVQTYLTAGSTGTAYVDSYSMTNQSGAATPTATPTASVTPSVTPSTTPSTTPVVTPSVSPTTTPTATPTPSGTNIVANGSFESGMTNWTTDNTTNVVLDTTSKGNNGANSLHFTSNTAYAHVFSDLIVLPDATSTYTWSTYVNALSGTGEFGFYIDEYDANGNWLSGQWKGMVSAIFTGLKTFTYVPTSANVKSVRLQYYQTPNSTFNLYIDSVSLGK